MWKLSIIGYNVIVTYIVSLAYVWWPRYPSRSWEKGGRKKPAHTASHSLHSYLVWGGERFLSGLPWLTVNIAPAAEGWWPPPASALGAEPARPAAALAWTFILLGLLPSRAFAGRARELQPIQAPPLISIFKSGSARGDHCCRSFPAPSPSPVPCHRELHGATAMLQGGFSSSVLHPLWENPPTNSLRGLREASGWLLPAGGKSWAPILCTSPRFTFGDVWAAQPREDAGGLHVPGGPSWEPRCLGRPRSLTAFSELSGDHSSAPNLICDPLILVTLKACWFPQFFCTVDKSQFTSLAVIPTISNIIIKVLM